jgi:hypothetical protein
MIYELRIYRCVPWLRRKLGQDRWLDAFTLLGKLGQVGVSPHSTPLAPRPAGLFLGSRVPRSTDTRPVGRMAMLETTTLLVVASPSPPGEIAPPGGFFFGAQLPRDRNVNARGAGKEPLAAV